MQNVPIRTPLGREIRGCFEAEDGNVLISADYSQIELRVLAHVAGEPVLKEIFRREEDVHTATASQVFAVEAAEIDPGMRSKAKMINYGIVYGLSDFGLADRLNIPREEAKEFIDAYLQRFPRVAAFMAETVERAKQQAYVKTLWGRRRQIPELQARNYQMRMLGERLAVNTVIQGTAADIIKLAMVARARRTRRPGLQTRLLLTIHDELLFEGPARGGRRGARARSSARCARCGTARSAARPSTSASARPGWRRSEPARAGRSRLLGVGAGCLVGCRRRSTRAWARASDGPGGDLLVPGRHGRAGVVASSWKGGLGGLGHVGRAPWWALVGGLLGAVYVTVALVAVRTLGASGLTAVVIAGQLISRS